MHIVPPIKPMFGITKFLSRDVYPERPSSVANSDVGIVLGDYKTKAQKRLFPIVNDSSFVSSRVSGSATIPGTLHSVVRGNAPSVRN